LTLKLNPELREMWEQVKNLSAHATHGQPEEILKMLMQAWLKNEVRKNFDSKNSDSKKSDVKSSHFENTEFKAVPTGTNNTFVKKESAQQNAVTPSRAIPAALKRQIWTRDGGKCTHCGSRFAIQIDHRQPFAANHTHDATNLRLLCRSCNLSFGIKFFGTVKMRRH
jgi:phage terminase large subunit GpA-like protein